MEKNIKKIIRELYEIDPTLRVHEKELKAIVKELLALRPESGFSEETMERIKREILARATSFSPEKTEKNMYDWRRFSVRRTLVGGAVVFAAFGLVFVLSGSMLGTRVPFFGDESKEVSVRGDRAFGDILFPESVSRAEKSGIAQGDGAAVAEVFGLGGGAGGGMVPPQTFPYPEKRVELFYDGGPISIPQNMKVFRKVSASPREGGISDILEAIGEGAIDTGAFENVSLNSLSFRENRPYGYYVDIIPGQGTVSVSKNWDTWPRPENGSASVPLRSSDLPEEEEAIAEANLFLEKYGVSTERYGYPEMGNEWRNAGIFSGTERIEYVPDSVNVVYPLILEGMFVYDESGGKMGISVSIDVRTRRAAGAWGINAGRFESSNYPVETDAEKIIAYAERGGRFGMFGNGPLALGTPEFSYTILRPQSPEESEFYVPALAFPVAGSGNGFSENRVIVPLVQTFWK